jgi:hypothetical protein
MCPHTTIYVSLYYFSRVCWLILLDAALWFLHTGSQIAVDDSIPAIVALYMRPHTVIYVTSYCNTCVLILLYMCPHTATHVSSYCYICVPRSCIPEPDAGCWRHNTSSRRAGSQLLQCYAILDWYKATSLLFLCRRLFLICACTACEVCCLVCLACFKECVVQN